MITPSLQHLEEIAFNALPSIKTLFYDGWVIRLSRGYTRRANSVNVLHGSSLPIQQKIIYCESLFQSVGQASIFRLTELGGPLELDRLLADRGYELDPVKTNVQVCVLKNLPPVTTDAVELHGRPHPEWLTAYQALSNLDQKHHATVYAILSQIVPSSCFALIRQDEQIVAVGMGVVERGMIGLFDIITHRDCRQQGYGRAIVLSLLNWGRQMKATHSYLQVVETNKPALNLYKALGYTTQYRYWYRQQS